MGVQAICTRGGRHVVGKSSAPLRSLLPCAVERSPQRTCGGLECQDPNLLPSMKPDWT